MTAAPVQAALPAASAPPDRRSGAGTANWSREFESARRLAWFQAPTSRRSDDPLGSRPTDGQAQGTALPEAGADTDRRAAGGQGSQRLDQRSAVANPTHFAAASSPPWAAALSSSAPVSALIAKPLAALAAPAAPVTRPIPASAPTATAPGPLAVAGAPLPPHATRHQTPQFQDGPRASLVAREPRGPVRVHAEATQHGIAVWLGVDGHPETQAARTAAVAFELRRLLAGSGQRLASLVCNGVAVDTPSLRSRQEP